MKIAISAFLWIENPIEKKALVLALKTAIAQKVQQKQTVAQSSLCPSSVPLARVQSYNMGELPQSTEGHLEGNNTTVQKRERKKRLQYCLEGGGGGGSIFLITSKPSGHLFNFCVSVLDPHQ